ncbi:MAG: gliding motility-associated C-terminal domain-containing protein [Bacteroidia bacterium]
MKTLFDLRKLLAICALVWLSGEHLIAQNVLYPGNVVITRFAETSDTDYIVKVFDIVAPGLNGATYGNNWLTPIRVPAGSATNSGWTPRRLGRVFGVTVDADGDIYVAATSVATYGFQAFNATGYGSAGSGGIYKITNGTWAVTDFVTTLPAASGSSTTQIPNVKTGIGNLCYDQWNDQLFATNMEDGKIYRIDMSGTIQSTFDPFSADNATAGFAPLGERIWGIAAYGGDTGATRIYFSRWYETYYTPNQPNEIWSVALDANGDFTGTARQELVIADFDPNNPSLGSNPTAQINFSDDGKMLIAERSMSNDTSTDAHSSRTMIYTYNAGVWNGPSVFNHGDDISTTQTFTSNCTGGSDFGYLLEDSTGAPAACDELVWSMADAIVFTGVYIYGLTGMPVAGNTMATADATSYYVDESNDVTTIPKSYLGSMKIFRDCNDSVFTPPPPPPPAPLPEVPCEFLNAVTPNDDGIHDYLEFSCVDSLGWKIVIYNRWGNKIYATDNYANNFPGGYLSDGVYYYVLEAADASQSRAGFFHVWNGQQ